MFAARMVDEGVSFFGSTARVTVTVGPDTMDGPDARDRDDASAGGCSTTRGSGLALALVLLALATARRRIAA